MSISTYAELQSAVADWLARPGDATITSIAPDLVRLAEARINRGSGEPGDPLYSPPLRVRQMETRATANASSEYVALPNDFLEMRELKVNGMPERKLSYVTPQHFAEAAASSGGGMPKVYTLASSQLRLGPSPTAAPVALEILYYAQVPALNGTTQASNWLLATAPNVYLFAALLEAAAYVGDEAQTGKWSGFFQASLMALQASDRSARHGGAPLVMRPLTTFP